MLVRWRSHIAAKRRNGVVGPKIANDDSRTAVSVQTRKQRMRRSITMTLVGALAVGRLVVGKELAVGDKAVPRWATVPIKVADKLIGTPLELRGPYSVAVIDGKYAWVKSPDGEGWIRRDELYSAAGGVTLYAAQIDALLKPPRIENLYLLRGDVWLEQGQPQKAIDDYTQAYNRGLKNHRLFLSRAAAYERLGKPENAIADCDQALKLNPQYAQAFIVRGRAFLRRGNLAAAQFDLAQAQRLAPTDAQVRQFQNELVTAQRTAAGALRR